MGWLGRMQTDRRQIGICRTVRGTRLWRTLRMWLGEDGRAEREEVIWREEMWKWWTGQTDR